MSTKTGIIRQVVFQVSGLSRQILQCFGLFESYFSTSEEYFVSRFAFLYFCICSSFMTFSNYASIRHCKKVSYSMMSLYCHRKVYSNRFKEVYSDFERITNNYVKFTWHNLSYVIFIVMSARVTVIEYLRWYHTPVCLSVFVYVSVFGRKLSFCSAMARHGESI